MIELIFAIIQLSNLDDTLCDTTVNSDVCVET